MRFHVKSHIDADPRTVWSLLTDVAGYTSWNTTVVKVDGEIAPGASLSLTSAVDPKRAFALTVESMEGTRMVWSSGMPLGLFRGARTIQVRAAGDGAEFEMEEVFSGLMAPLITKMIPDLQPSFDQWAADLKQRAEAG
ncbi:MAG: SRPBCC domain-containing protein [Alphaproteobacteria bacterium]|nr:SRPBCC domain-containing protein [Alphaproteobacteria bacterium]